MPNQLFRQKGSGQPAKALLSLMSVAVLSACASFSGIGSKKEIATTQQFQAAQSLPAEHGRWPAADWADQFGDHQLPALIAEALAANPSLDEARARIASAIASSETARANTGPKVNGDYSTQREKFTEHALVPPTFGGSWQTENKAVISASYDLDLWGRNRQALHASLSQVRVAQAESEQVKLTLSAAVARSYNELARLFALRDLAEQEVAQWRDIKRLSEQRAQAGLDTDTERETSQHGLSASLADLTALDGRILDVRYQLGALLGKGPDRGLSIARPQLSAGDAVRLPDILPADLLSRRPDIVAARWRVDASTAGIEVARADFYPNINLTAAAGLDSFGFGRFLTGGSSIASFGPAVHLPIFDSGALRAQLKGKYADFDLAVAQYNRNLIAALSDVATELARVRSNEAQEADTVAAAAAASRAYRLAASQYQAGLTTQLTVLQTRINALQSDQAVINLRMNRRGEQIALAAALGGGFVDASQSTTQAAARSVHPTN
jgi:NodT family efflux transporter outer membrane factor (OMF) lipoprotein